MASRHSRSGKIVDKWDLRIHDAPYQVKLRMRDLGSFGDPTTQFFVKLDDGEELIAPDNDVDKLREAVIEKLREQDRTVWKEVLHIEVIGGAPYKGKLDDDDDDEEYEEPTDYSHSFTEGLDVQWQKYEVGTKPDGTKCYRELGRFPDIRDGELEVGLESVEDFFHGERLRRMRAVVPATPENEAALREIQASLVLLAERVKDFMSPKKIKKTLQMSTARLLAAPKQTKGDK